MPDQPITQSPNHQTTILALGSYFKGTAFLQQCKELGCTVYLLTKEKYNMPIGPARALTKCFGCPKRMFSPTSPTP